MQVLEQNAGLTELSVTEMNETDGGFLPPLVIGAIWGAQLCCSLVATGIYIQKKREGVIK